VNKAQFYRPCPKWNMALALAFAGAIHLSAVAIAARHPRKKETAVEPFTSIEAIDPGPDASTPPPIEVSTPPQAASIEDPEFVEPPRPPRLSFPRVAGPIRPSAIPRMAAAGNPKAYAISTPRPEYPYQARSRHVMGSGVALITIDLVTGSVVAATMEQSTGSAVLDNSTLSAFKRWRFKPGTVSKVRIPITFDLAGPSY
jgi:TonB family protein